MHWLKNRAIKSHWGQSLRDFNCSWPWIPLCTLRLPLIIFKDVGNGFLFQTNWLKRKKYEAEIDSIRNSQFSHFGVKMVGPCYSTVRAIDFDQLNNSVGSHCTLHTSHNCTKLEKFCNPPALCAFPLGDFAHAWVQSCAHNWSCTTQLDTLTARS